MTYQRSTIEIAAGDGAWVTLDPPITKEVDIHVVQHDCNPVAGAAPVYDQLQLPVLYVDARTDRQRCEAEMTDRQLFNHICDGATPIPRRVELPNGDHTDITEDDDGNLVERTCVLIERNGAQSAYNCT